MLNYKSLGCGITVLSSPNIPPVVSYVHESVQNVLFSEGTSNANNTLKLSVSTEVAADPQRKNAIIEQVLNNVITYINSLKMGEDVLKSGIAACVYKAYTDLGYTDYAFSINTFPTALQSAAAITQNANQKAYASTSSVYVTIA